MVLCSPVATALSPIAPTATSPPPIAAALSPIAAASAASAPPPVAAALSPIATSAEAIGLWLLLEWRDFIGNRYLQTSPSSSFDQFQGQFMRQLNHGTMIV